MGAVRSEVQKKTVAFGFGRCPTHTRPLPLLVCHCPNAHTAFAALVVVRLNLTRTHPRACVAFRSEVDWGQRGVAVKASAVGEVRTWQTHRFTHAHTHARAQVHATCSPQILTTHAHHACTAHMHTLHTCCTHLRIHTCAHTHAHPCTHTCAHTHAHHTCTPHMHTHAHTCMHTHACSPHPMRGHDVLGRGETFSGVATGKTTPAPARARRREEQQSGSVYLHAFVV